MPTDTETPAAELGGINETLIFFREDGFYPVQGVTGIPLDTQAAQHAALNPGTLKVTDIAGRVLWLAVQS